MSAFSDFIRNASTDEKKRVYEEVLRRASERQAASITQKPGELATARPADTLGSGLTAGRDPQPACTAAQSDEGKK